MSNQIKNQIDDIIRKRKSRLQELELEIKNCIDFESLLNQCEEYINNYISKNDIIQDNVDLCNKFLENIPLMRKEVNDLRQQIDDCYLKFNKNTLNIGFGGTKGVGKSYLLQKISGLTDNEIPSNGNGYPVTAVSSRIFNSNEEKAIIEFYSEQTFIANVLQPYFQSIGMPCPRTLNDFCSLQFEENKPTDEAYIQQLMLFQQHVNEFKPYLTGTTRDFPLNNIRQFVAYTDENDNPCFTYLAVKDAEIHTHFPQTEVVDLGLIDLPGLGELNPTIAARHTSGIKDTVDAALIIRRPAGTRVDWDNDDENAYKALCKATRLDKKEDFLLVVQNEYGCDPEKCDIARRSTLDKHPKLKILTTNSSTTEGLSNEILMRVLTHLSNFLPDMDKEITDEINNTKEDLVRRIRETCTSYYDNFRSIPSNNSEHQGYIISKYSDRFRKIFNNECEIKIQNFDVKSGEENDDVVEKIEDIKSFLYDYIDNGLDYNSVEEWINNEVINIENYNLSPLFTKLSKDMRIIIANKFCVDLDDVYKKLIQNLHGICVDIFRLMYKDSFFSDEMSPFENIKYIRKRIGEDKNYSYEKFKEALDAMINLQIIHRTQFYPRVYDHVRAFKNQTGREQDKYIPKVASNDKRKLAEDVYYSVSHLAKASIEGIANDLKVETICINDTLLVAFEYFHDLICNNKHCEHEWYNFTNYFFEDLQIDNNNKPKVNNIIALLERMSKINL